MSEEVLDEETWKVEAQAVINDIKNHVHGAEISKLQSCNQRIYLNLTTLEDKEFCVELSGRGFRLAGAAHDVADLQGDEYFETPYSLLSTISPNFHTSFGNALLDKLTTLSQGLNSENV